MKEGFGGGDALFEVSRDGTVPDTYAHLTGECLLT